MDWRDAVDFGVDQFGEVVGIIRGPQPVLGGGVAVGSTYYPPLVASTQGNALLVLGVVGLAAFVLLKR